MFVHSGIWFDIDNPDIRIKDIAHALSLECRYGGHSKYFYSVAEHCVLLCDYCESIEDKRAMLMHDAAEAYIKDIPRCLKVRPEFQAYRNAEEKLHYQIMTHFGLPRRLTTRQESLDRRIVLNEMRILFDRFDEDMASTFSVYPLDNIQPMFWPNSLIERRFLNRFSMLFPDYKGE